MELDQTAEMQSSAKAHAKTAATPHKAQGKGKAKRKAKQNKSKGIDESTMDHKDMCPQVMQDASTGWLDQNGDNAA